MIARQRFSEVKLAERKDYFNSLPTILICLKFKAPPFFPKKNYKNLTYSAEESCFSILWLMERVGFELHIISETVDNE